MKTICFFTGTRAEYGLLKPLIIALKNIKGFKVKLIVSGMHMSPEFGLTYKDIEADNLIIDEKIEILLSSDTPVGVSKTIGLGLISISEALQRVDPDALVLLGDRFEVLSAACAAVVARIPIIHLHGGEATYGLIDEPIRHAVTKMSHLHFTSTSEYRKRVIQLGEKPETVFNVGAIGIDNINSMKLLSKRKLEEQLKVRFREKNFLVTFHPVTLEKNTSEQQFKSLLKVFDLIKDTLIIFTKANSDTEGRIINQIIDRYVADNPDKAISFSSMGQLKYLSTMKYVDAVVGNSSSGIIEAPSFRVGTINIGDRQKGRIRAGSIIDCQPDEDSIRDAFKILESDNFQKKLKKVQNPHGDGNTATKIVDILLKFDLSDIIKKEFYDIDFKI